MKCEGSFLIPPVKRLFSQFGRFHSTGSKHLPTAPSNIQLKKNTAKTLKSIGPLSVYLVCCISIQNVTFPPHTVPASPRRRQILRLGLWRIPALRLVSDLRLRGMVGRRDARLFAAAPWRLYLNMAKTMLTLSWDGFSDVSISQKCHKNTFLHLHIRWRDKRGHVSSSCRTIGRR